MNKYKEELRVVAWATYCVACAVYDATNDATYCAAKAASEASTARYEASGAARATAYWAVRAGQSRKNQIEIILKRMNKYEKELGVQQGEIADLSYSLFPSSVNRVLYSVEGAIDRDVKYAVSSAGYNSCRAGGTLQKHLEIIKKRIK